MTMIYGELKLQELMICLPGTVVGFLRHLVNFLSSGHTVFLIFLLMLLAATYPDPCWVILFPSISRIATAH